MSLTNGQVEQFLEIKLGFNDWEPKLSGDKLNFLRELMARYVSTMYYENITWGAKKLEELQTPTVTEVIEHGTGTAGGACVHLNYFIKLLLEKLGFDVFVVAGEVPFLNIPRNHMLTIVRLPPPVPVPVSVPVSGNLNEDTASPPTPNENVNGGGDMKVSDEEFELYLIDVGFGRSIFEPISLNKAHLPYMGKAAGFSFEVRFNPDLNLYERYLKGGCPIRGKFESETDEKVAYFFDLIPLKFEDFDDAYRRIFTDPTESFFLNTWFLFRFITLGTSAISNSNNSGENVNVDNCAPFDYKYVSCRGKSICFGTVNDLEEIKYETYTEMIPMVQKWFPNLNQDTVRLAVSRYEQIRQ